VRTSGRRRHGDAAHDAKLINADERAVDMAAFAGRAKAEFQPGQKGRTQGHLSARPGSSSDAQCFVAAKDI
jgi:hypothetical protein